MPSSAPTRKRSRSTASAKGASRGRVQTAAFDDVVSGLRVAELAKANGRRGRNGNGSGTGANVAVAHSAGLNRKQLLSALTALKRGDFSVRLSEGLPGDDGRIAQAFNQVIELNQRMAEEIERLGHVVGKEGRISQRASIGRVSGGWATQIASVNALIGDLVHPTSETARVIGAVAQGDLSQSMDLNLDGRPLSGEFLRTAKTVNTMVDQLATFAAEVTRVAREVGTEGKLGGQARVKGVAGTWKDLTDSVNSMAGNLTAQVRNIAQVTTAVANGDLSTKITVDVKGEMLELKGTINTMVDQLRSLASEVTRVAREVGTEGKLGGQASVPGVAGTWKDLSDSVNSMARNLTAQVRNIAQVTTAVANGDLSTKITVDVKGEILELKDTINTMVDQLRSFAAEVTRVAREVGTEGRLGGQASVPGVAGTWKDLTDNVNSMASNLTSQVRNIAAVTTAVARGDLSKKITVNVKGEIEELKDTINTMVDQLNSFASEVTRVAREVGTEGKLGGQAKVPGVAGTWKDLTENVNFMADRLTNQVRGIAKVVTAVANGNLTRKLQVAAKGEIAELADTINNMIDTLATFADQVTTVAREVGVEGKLGGQASVPGAAGTWRDLTDNVNQLAANLTTQVRAIADVATAVTRGDLTRSIQVAAKAEVAALKDNINEMIRNLRETTLKNSEQDWLKTNLAKFSRMLQGQKDLLTVGRLILSELAPVVSAQHGVFYTMDARADAPTLTLLASYAYKERKNIDTRFRLGEGLVGQCALEKEKILLSNVPNDYIKVTSGLGEAVPLNIIVMPVVFEGRLKAVLELASFERFSPTHQVFLDQLCESIGIVLNTIEANTRTEDLLAQSQSLARELQSQQEELQHTNQKLEEKAKLLADQNVEVERKNREVEHASQALEEKARQLALTSKYKSEFLANMSHELRTPLNSLLILSDQLSKNADGNLSSRQIEFARTIHSAGNDLLALINDILDLSKIESGTVVVDVGDVAVRDLGGYVDRTFRHIAENKALEFRLEIDNRTPRSMHTDPKRLQQILKNLLSNAIKFTEKGAVSLRVELATSGWNHENEILNRAQSVLAFSVEDTGIGIPADKQQIIFEAFQQADGSTSRKYGGTGLGLAISREIARMLGGEIHLTSAPSKGSRFTVYLPQVYLPPRTRRQVASVESAVVMPPAVIESSVPTVETDPVSASDVADDADSLQPGDATLLVIENDPYFARVVVDVAHEQGFKVLVTARGAAGIALARQHAPSAITLDINLPDRDGWRVLGRLKDDIATRHIPVYVITTDDERERALRLGALGALIKPLRTRQPLDHALARMKVLSERRTASLVLACSGPARCAELSELLRSESVDIRAVNSGADALATVLDRRPDLVVVDMDLPDGSAFDCIEEMARQSGLADLPMIVYTARELSRREEVRIKRLTQTVALRDVRSPERLLDDATLYLHQSVDALPAPRRKLVEDLHRDETLFAGRKVLVVDDDIRNIFAMTSVLERFQMQVQSAETGRAAIQALQDPAEVDVVLMDIMMPDMDGYETMRAIRKQARFRSLPIIALTARAMSGDREKCIDAGASDYIAKPVDSEQLVGMLRNWLHR